MLDCCDIDYTDKQVRKLEKLLNTFLKKYLISIKPEFIDTKQDIAEMLRKEKVFDESSENASLQVKKCKDFENIALTMKFMESKNPKETVITADQNNLEKFESEIEELKQEKKSKWPMPQNVQIIPVPNNICDIDVGSENNMIKKDSQCKKSFNSEIIIKTTIHKTISPMDEVRFKNMDSLEDKNKEYQNNFVDLSPLNNTVKKSFGNLKLTEDSQFPCKICPKYFTSLKELKSHILEEHSNIEHFGCSNCDIVFRSKAIMVIHQEFVHNCTAIEVATMKKQCILCEQSFFGWKIVSHLKICEELKNGCPKCDKVFDLKQGILARGALRKHIKNCQSIENQKSILCELCGKSCANKSANIEHMKEYHTGDFFQRNEIFSTY